MLYREIITVYPQINTEHVNRFCEQKVDFFVKLCLVVRIVITGL